MPRLRTLSCLCHHDRKRLIRKLAILTAASSALFATPAQAQSSDRWIPGAGVFFGYAFGSRTGFEWGMETFATYRFSGLGCSGTTRSGMGPLAQLAFVNLGEPRVTLAAQGGSELSTFSATAITGELGGTYRFGDRPAFAIHTGVTPEFAIFYVSFRTQWLQEDYALNWGARYLATYGGPGYCVEGRPLRTSDGSIAVGSPASCRRDITSDAGPADDAVLLAGTSWQSAAQYECASVPAFLQLAADLLAHDAPDALVERALAAAEDEMQHAHLCAAVASRYLGIRVYPALPDVVPRSPLEGTAGLVRLATESWLDGCLGEGAAASRAARAARLATDPIARGAQRTIARDEARHAALGWSVLQWAMQRGGDEARAAVRSLRNAEISGATGSAYATTERYGRLGVSHTYEVTERHCAQSRARLDILSSSHS
jgi:hypothetical protein